MRSTHTFVELKVSDSTWSEIAQLLRDAGYGHVFIGGAIDMSGIALVVRDPDDDMPGLPAIAGGLEGCDT